MHPLVRQMPPGSSLSITAIRMLGLSRIIGSTMFIADPLPITIRSYSFIQVDATSKQISVWRLAFGSPIDWDGRAIAHSYEATQQALLGVEEWKNFSI